MTYSCHPQPYHWYNGLSARKSKVSFGYEHIFVSDFSLIIEKIPFTDRSPETKDYVDCSGLLITHKISESIREIEEVCSGVLLYNPECFYMLYFYLYCALKDYCPVLILNFRRNTFHLKLNVCASEILPNHL